MTITEFLESRIAEDEAAARDAFEGGLFGAVDDGAWDANTSSAMPNVEGSYMEIMVSEELGSMNRAQAFHIARHDPARVLAECAAKRAIILLCEDVEYMDSRISSEWGGPNDGTADDILRALAAIYASHPDYQQEWAA